MTGVKRRLQNIGETIYICLPKQIADAYGLKKGDYVDITIKNGKIVIENLEKSRAGGLR